MSREEMNSLTEDDDADIQLKNAHKYEIESFWKVLTEITT